MLHMFLIVCSDTVLLPVHCIFLFVVIFIVLEEDRLNGERCVGLVVLTVVKILWSSEEVLTIEVAGLRVVTRF